MNRLRNSIALSQRIENLQECFKKELLRSWLTEVENFDSKGLSAWASLRKEVVLVANVDLWELWDKQRYDE